MSRSIRRIALAIAVSGVAWATALAPIPLLSDDHSYHPQSATAALPLETNGHCEDNVCG